MKKLSIITLLALVLTSCGGGSDQKSVEENKEAKTMLQGIWVDS